MQSHRITAREGNRSRRGAASKRRSGPPAPAPNTGERDPFLEIQAESGRRMRPFIAEHYGDIE